MDKDKNKDKGSPEKTNDERPRTGEDTDTGDGSSAPPNVTNQETPQSATPVTEAAAGNIPVDGERGAVAVRQGESEDPKKRGRTEEIVIRPRIFLPPKKKGEVVPPPRTVPKCATCGKVFASWKRLFGHLRSHPEREYRGAFPPPTNKGEEPWWKGQPYPKGKPKEKQPRAKPGLSPTQQQELVAKLMHAAEEISKKLDQVETIPLPPMYVGESSSARGLDIDLNQPGQPPSPSPRNALDFDLNVPPQPESDEEKEKDGGGGDDKQDKN